MKKPLVLTAKNCLERADDNKFDLDYIHKAALSQHKEVIRIGRSVIL